VVRTNYEIATGTADWTTFDTIGGYIPTIEGGLQFEPGIVLRALRSGSWLVIDELNRADIDRAFGPLFTLLASSGDGVTRRVVLPYRRDGRPVVIRWAESVREARNDYVVTPNWRLLGTLNLADKATLFQLSFAFLRRFALINVPLPGGETYRSLIATFFSGAAVSPEDIAPMVECAWRLATGPRELGPAIVRDVSSFVLQAFVPSADSTTAYDQPLDAFITALRLYAVPQYEGASADEIDEAYRIVRTTWPKHGDFVELRKSLERVAIS
jgi:MoxR-like ATPase